MHEAVLLANALGHRQLQLALTRGQCVQLCADEHAKSLFTVSTGSRWAAIGMSGAPRPRGMGCMPMQVVG